MLRRTLKRAADALTSRRSEDGALVPKPMIAECTSWDELLGALLGQAPRVLSARIPHKVAQGVLAAPAAIARWIIECSPELVRRDVLEIMIVGAERLDAVDQGRWYQLIPLLVGANMLIRVTLVGDRLDANFASPAIADAPRTVASCYRGSLAQFLTSSAVRPPAGLQPLMPRRTSCFYFIQDCKNIALGCRIRV